MDALKKCVAPTRECLQSVRTNALCIQTSGIYQIKIVFPQNYETLAQAAAAATLSLKTLRHSDTMLKFELKLTKLDIGFPQAVFATLFHIRLQGTQAHYIKHITPPLTLHSVNLCFPY
jgi:hypothetical protein